MSAIECVFHRHASANTVMHCLYGYYFLGMKKSRLAVIYRKDEKTIANWIQRYDETGNYQRRSIPANRTFSKAEKEWIIAFYHVNPLSFLDEAKSAFTKPFHRTISISHVWTIIHDYGMTWKICERNGLNMLEPTEHYISRRNKFRQSWHVEETRFSRKPRVSLLCFLGADGILDYYDVEETFDRSSFARYCTVFAHSGHVQMYPDIILYLRQIGIVPFFLPAYSPFFNQIEYLFGYLKKAFQRHYAECRIERNVIYFVVKIMEKFKRFNMAKDLDTV
ncbi:unnamed protein product [Aphanomyces euteiches]